MGNVESSGATLEEADNLRRSTFKAKRDESAPSTHSGRRVVSYKDICAGINGVDNEDDEDDIIDHSGSDSDEEDEAEERENDDMGVEEQQDPLCPVIKITKQELKEACKPWRKAIIVKLLGKKLGLNFLRVRLQRLWQPVGEMEIIDLDHEYYIVRFSNSADYSHVFDGGPWVILGHCLVIQQWQPGFNPEEGAPGKAAVWVRIPKFPVELYGKRFLWRIANSLGKLVRVDDRTMKIAKDGGQSNVGTEKCRFARLCVEVDLRKALVAQFTMNDQIYKIEYEGLHQICFHCGRFGHRLDGCPLASLAPGVTAARGEKPILESQQTPAAAAEPFGEWMIVKRDKRKGGQQAKSKGAVNGRALNSNSKMNNGSRFNALVNEKEVIGETSNGQAASMAANVEIIAINDIDMVTGDIGGNSHVHNGSMPKEQLAQQNIPIVNANYGGVNLEENILNTEAIIADSVTTIEESIIPNTINQHHEVISADSLPINEGGSTINTGAAIVENPMNKTREAHVSGSNSIISIKKAARGKGPGGGSKVSTTSVDKPIIIQDILGLNKKHKARVGSLLQDQDEPLGAVRRERDRSLSPGSTKRST